MPKNIYWKVPQHVFDYLNMLAAQVANGQISADDYIERLRLAGFPPEAEPGDHIHIQLTKPTVGQVPRDYGPN